MKQLNKYETPEVVIVKISEEDVITTSLGDSLIIPIGEDW